MMLEHLKRAGSRDPWQYDSESFTLRSKEHQLYLGNVYAAYARAETGVHRARILSNFVSGTLAAHEEFIPREEALERAVTVVRERALFAFQNQMLIANGAENLPEVVSEPLTEWFCRCVVLDSDTAMRFVHRRDLDEWRGSIKPPRAHP